MPEANRNCDDLNEYVRQGEPDAQRLGYLWKTAVGLQAVDGLVPSDFLLQTAQRNIVPPRNRELLIKGDERA